MWVGGRAGGGGRGVVSGYRPPVPLSTSVALSALAQDVLEHRLQLHCSDGGMAGDGVVKDDHKDDYDGDRGDEHEPPPDAPGDSPESNQRDRMAKVLHEAAVSGRVARVFGQGGKVANSAEPLGDKIGDHVANSLPDAELP